MAALYAACSSCVLVSPHALQAVNSALRPLSHLSLSHGHPAANVHKWQIFRPPLPLRHSEHSVASELKEVELKEEEDEEEEEEEGDFENLSEEDYERAAKLAATEYRQSLLEEILLEDEAAETGGRKRKKKPSRVSYEEENRVPDHLLPKVVVVGRPNVGKSALFNRIAGGDLAIVHDEPGVTRDRLYGRAYWGLQEFMLVDTGGVMTIPNRDGMDVDGIAVTSGGGPEALDRAMRDAAAAGLPALIEKQAAAAVEESCSIIFVVDGQAGVTAADIDIANWLRKKHSNKTITLAVNKCESPTKGFLQAAEFWSLGFDPLAISAISGTGTGDLLDAVCANLKTPQLPDEQQDVGDRPLAISIVGKPNVGKSSILNALVGEERTIVSPISGTTRDAVDTDFVTPDGQTVKLIDTAGIRRRSAIASAGSVTESLSVNRAFRAIRRSDVVALVIDAMACVTEQDYKLGERIEKEGKACVIVVNKWDTILEKDNKTTVHYERDVRDRLRVLDWAPIVYSSATSGQRIQKILVAAIAAGKERARRLTTATLNQVLHEALLLRQPPTTRGGKKGKMYYCTQAGIRPPTFVLFVNDAKLFPEMYRRYMEKQVRKNVGYPGTPIRLLWRGKEKSGREKSKGKGQ